MQATQSEVLHLFSQGKDVPPYVFSFGQGNGPHAIIVGALHGNENTGLATIVDIHKQRDRIQGTITAVLGNPKAYKKNVRYINEDLNRVFHNPIIGTSYEATRARELNGLFRQIAQRGTATVIDVHTMSAGTDPLFICHQDDSQAQHLARQVTTFNTMVLITDDGLPTSLCALAQRYSFQYIGMECGQHQTKQASRNAHMAMWEILTRSGVAVSDEKLPTTTPKTILKMEQPIAIAEGLRFTLDKLRTITPIAKGEVYAVDVNSERIAEKDIALFCPSKDIQMTDADAGFICTYKN